MAGGYFRDHLAVVGGGAEQVRVERDARDRLVVERLGEIGGLDLRPLRYAHLVEAIERTVVVWPRGAQEIDKILGVAQVGKVGRRHDQDVVRTDERTPGPAAPLMRYIKHHARDCRA